MGKTIREIHEAGAKPVNVLIKNKETGEEFEDEFWPDTPALQELIEIFQEEYGDAGYTLLKMNR